MLFPKIKRISRGSLDFQWHRNGRFAYGTNSFRRWIMYPFRVLFSCAIVVIASCCSYGQTEINRLEAENIYYIPKKPSQIEVTASVASEIRELRKEIASLRQMLERLLTKTPTLAPPLPPPKPVTRKVWKRVREPIQLEGGIDDGYELVDEPVK